MIREQRQRCSWLGYKDSYAIIERERGFMMQWSEEKVYCLVMNNGLRMCLESSGVSGKLFGPC